MVKSKASARNGTSITSAVVMRESTVDPKMYLLNPKGEIVAVDLRGEELERKVASFFN